ncbi:thioredoxin [Candidatus Microgenomates bacterium]|nr:MAG: thioredoxin [Candidatus Microgenomates bacterium]
MKKYILLIILVVAIGVVALLFLFNLASTPSPADSPAPVADNSDNFEPTQLEKAKVAVFPNNNASAAATGKYVHLSTSGLDEAKTKRRVYFFAASWCPTCQAANAEFLSNLDKIPDDVVIFITNYDEEIELKAKYYITYQHTFVQVDANGNEIAKWTGGDVNELLENII